jgi:hypothetical protein
MFVDKAGANPITPFLHPGCIFTILHFICNLLTGPMVFVGGNPFQLGVMEPSNLFGRFASYDENGVL